MPNLRIERAIDTIIRAIETAAKEHAAYDADPHPRKADQDYYRSHIDLQRDTAIASARADLAQEAATVETLYSKMRRTSYDEPAIAAAWTRISSLLSTGRGIDDVVAREGFSRDEAEALRRNYAAFLAAQDPNLRPVDVERRTAPALRRVLQAEVRLMPTAEAETTTAEVERHRIGDVLRAIDKMGVEAAHSGKVSGQAMLEVGYAQNAAGITPPERSWKSIVDSIDPEWRAKLAGPSLIEAAEGVGFEPMPEASLDLRR